MNTFAKIALIAVAVTPIPYQIARADSRHSIVETPNQCPEGLTIESTANKGMIDFDVSVDADEVADAGELYKGRVRTNTRLSIATAEQQIAFVTLHGATEGKRTRYQFRISPSAAKTSELQLGIYLYEKDGMATVGGGVSMQVKLAGFEPKASSK